jgi:hypothetical protein
MRSILIALLLLTSFSAAAQETTIRVLGVYVSGQTVTSSRMTQHLQGIASAWNSSGLPAASVTTVQLLNSAVAVPVTWTTMPSTLEATATAAADAAAIRAVRQQWQADIVVVFRGPDPDGKCGVAPVFWYDGNFQLTNGLDLRYRNTAYVTAVNPGCFTQATAHEFGHLLGGGHVTNTSSRLYDDARAFTISSTADCNINRVPVCMTVYNSTALADIKDYPVGSSLSTQLQYSRNAATYGDSGHNNVRTLALTARSVANFYPYPSNPVAVLRPPVAVLGINYGCSSDGSTRHYIYWQNDLATNVVVDRYEVWYSQPVSTFYRYGWTVFSPYTDSYVWGATARARPNACSGSTCSALSAEYYDAAPLACGGTGGGVSPGS